MSEDTAYVVMNNSYRKKCRILDRSRQYAPRVSGEKWFRGKPFSTKVDQPLTARLMPMDERHPEMAPRWASFMGRSGLPILRDDLIEAMQAFGVENLESYELDILDPDNGNIVTNYKVVNIIGLIEAADMVKSKSTVADGIPLIDVVFDELHLDQSKLAGQNIFRLAENPMTILVHKSLADYLLSSGFDDIEFYGTTEVAL